MKIVVIEGTGLIGRTVVSQPIALGHEALEAAPASGIRFDDRLAEQVRS